MICGGVSLKGSHAVNQDSFASRKVRGGYVLAVSDGLGSRAHSQAGSATLCEAACLVAEKFSCAITDDENFLSAIHSQWLKILSENNLAVEACNATALICVVGEENIWAFRLGDGFICVAAAENVAVLFDAKDDAFVNETECLRTNFDFGKWECRRLPREKFLGVVAATDGVTFRLDEKNLGDFMGEFCANYRALDLTEIIADVTAWLPTLFGSDDKTLAFLLEEANHF